MLTSYDGTAITYDQIGNPLTYYNGSAYTFTWEGRKLVGATKGSNNLTFVYNDEGIRTSKTVNGVKHTYYLNGSQIVAEQWADKLLVFTYDASGSPIGMSFRNDSYAADQWDVYWFEKNLQGDITSVYNSSGVQVATYSYTTAWGEHSAYLLDSSEVGASYNPFRYRGYYYDVDLEMYYLQSRYYDSKICRFINSDSALYSTMLGCNLFAYCENNPSTRVDYNGDMWQFVPALDPRNMVYGGGSDSELFGFHPGYTPASYDSTSYATYLIRNNVAANDANLGGYHFGGGSYIGGSTAAFIFGSVSVNDSMARDHNYTSRGSTGRLEPKNLKEKLAMEEVKSNPLSGSKQIPVPMTDSRWPATDGWVKMASNINGVEIHFVYNKIFKIFDDFKFK